MAKTWGHGLKAFAGGFQTGLSLKMERAKIDALKEEQKRLEKAQKEAERLFQEWYNSPETKDFCANLDTASQGERAYFITGIRRISEDIFKYYTEIDNDIREGNIEEAKSKNDLLEQKIKSATDLAKLGMIATFPDGSPMKISPEDIQFQKQIQIGKMAGGPTGEAMGRQMWKRRGLEEITPTPEAPTMADEKTAVSLLRTFLNATPKQFEDQKTRIEKIKGVDLSAYTQDILREAGDELYNLYNTPEEVMANVKAPMGLTVIPKRDTKTGKYYGSFSKETGITSANEYLFGKKDVFGNISSMGIVPYNAASSISYGTPLTDKQKDQIRNNHNLQKSLISEDVLKKVELVLQQMGISLEAPGVTPEPTITPEPELGLIQKVIEGAKEWLGMEGIPKTEEIPTPKVPTGAKEAMIPTMTKEEVRIALRDTDPADPLYKALYDWAVKQGWQSP